MVGRSRQHASLHPRKKPTKKRRADDLSVSLRKRRCRRVFALLLALAGSLVSTTAFAQVPTGADVVAGSAAISAAGNALNVDASSARTIVNWDQFSIGAGNAANFNLPDANSAILNRVTGTDLSTINGALNSNGHVFLVNPNGIMVGNSGVVNTNGFTASVFDVGNADFMAGGPLRFSGESNASIVNNGLISTGAGGANLIANSIANNGTIESVGGNITLAGGGEVTLSNGVTYVQPSLDTLASGISPTANLIQNEGTIRATGAATSGGEVYLVKPNGKILHDGTIAAQNVASDETSTGGHVQLEASDITLADGSIIDATGTNGGGEVLVGGDWQGTGNMHQATTVMMESGATIDASAMQQGDGGKVVLWSDIFDDDSVTTVMGTLIARAGDLIGGLVGNGGKIETSGHDLRIDGARVDAGSILGAAGLWLLDPDNYTIDATAAANIGTALSTTDVTVTTASGGAFGGTTVAGSGDILVDSSITKSGGSGTTTLTLQADRSVVMQPGASINGVSGAPLNVVLWANNDESLDGSVTLRSVNTQGGHLYVGGGAASTTWNGLTVPDGAASSYDIAGAPVTFAGDVNTGGGDVSIWAGSEGTGAINLSGASSINSGSGDITLIADDVTGTSLAITSTGHFTFKPNGNAWTGFGSVFDYDGTISGNTFTGSPSQNVNWLTINNYNTLGGLTLGKTGNTSGIAPSVSGNTYTFDDGANGSAIISIEATGATTSTGGLLNVGSYTLGTTNVTETHSNFNDNVTIVGSHTVTRTELTPTVSGATKVYDGTTSLAGQTLGATGVGSGDIVNIAGVGSFASKNAGTGLGYSVENLAISGADANNYFLGSTSTSATDGTITPKAVTLTAPTLTKVYDGNTSGTATATHLAQLNAALGVAGDYVNSLTLTFDDKNVGTGKTLTPSAATIVDGNGGNNYSITYGTNNTSSITRLDSVTWIGGPTGDWSDPANWAGGAIPDLANVANVVIPEGSTPTFDNTVAGPVEIDSLTGGNFAMDSGTLEVADDFSVTGFTQNGGDLDVGGDFTTTGSFTQRPGATLAVDGDADITHSNGDLTVHSLDADNATLHSTNGGVVLGDVDTTGDLTVQADSGDITQTPTSDLTVGGEATLAADGDITLDGNNNDFQGTVNADGDDVLLRDSTGDLALGDVQTTGDLDVTSADGDITQNADSTISVAGKTTLDAAGDIDLREGTNQFTGPVNLDGNNIEVTQSNGDITLGTVNADGNFWVDAPNGGINQNPGRTITTGGSTTLFAGGAVNLPGSNNFGGNVTTNSVVFNVNSIVPFTTILAGAALGGSASEKIAQSTYDAFVRYVTGENDGEDAPIFVVDTAESFVEEFARWVGRIDTNWLETAEALDEAGEIYIRRKKRVDGDEVS